MVFDDLSVRVTANTGSFERGIDSAERSLTGMVDNVATASASLQTLQGRADEAGDEIRSVGRAATTTSPTLFGLSGASTSVNAGFLSLGGSGPTAAVGLSAVAAAGTALLSTLVPLAAAVGTVTAGVGALAGAFGAVIGTGLLAFGEERGEQNAERLAEVNARIDALESLEEETGSLTNAQQEQLESLEDQADELEDQTGVMGGLQSAMADLREEIQPIISEFGQQFIPLIEDTIGAIPDLVENIFDAIGGVGMFTDALRDFGQAAMTAIPALVGGMFDLARRALPLARRAISWLGNNGAQIMQGMLRITREIAPVFMDLGQTIGQNISEWAQLGTAVLNRVVPALGAYIDIVGDIVNFSQGSGGFVNLLKDLVNRGITWFENTGIGMLVDVGSTLVSGLGDLIQEAENWLAGGGQEQLTSLATTFYGEIGTAMSNVPDAQIRGIVTSVTNIIGDVFDAMINALGSDEAGSLGGQIGRFGRVAMQQLGDEIVEYAGSEAFQEDLVGLGDAIVNSLGSVLVGYFKKPRNLLKLSGPGALFTLSTDLISGGEGAGSSAQGNIEAEQQPLQQGSEARGTANELRLILEEKTDVVEARIDEGVDRRLSVVERRTDRGT